MRWKLDEGHRPNHNCFALYYHVVFVTHKREPLIDREAAACLTQFFQKKSQELEVHLLEQAVLCDHVHLILSLRPTQYLPEVINYLKGSASREANSQAFMNNLYWMRGYHVSTIGEKGLPAVRNYVQRQFEHHPEKVPG